MNDGIVIAGGGLAGQRCSETLRARGFDGPIRVLCEEWHPPYDRPPLSKDVLTGRSPAAATALRPRAWYDEQRVDLMLGVRATGLNLAAARVELSRGPSLRYEQLLIATGAVPRMLPSLEGYENVTTFRTLRDAQRLARAFRPGARIAIVGAGFIGLEVAAAARSRGAEVTIVEAGPAPLGAVLGIALGGWFADLHGSEGVDMVVSAKVDAVKGSRRARELVLTGGRRVRCDHVVVGVGVDPASRWLDGSGLGSPTITVDAAGRSAAPRVYAAGDVARVFDRALGKPVRTEHWEAGARQGAAAARAMLGLETPAPPPASFWSDQYGVRIQYVGHAAEADRFVTRGDRSGRQFAVEFTRAGATVAELLVGLPRELPAARRRVQAGLESLRPTATRSAA